MPLWDQLIRFKMEEASIKDIMPKATINPIYSAIRETIKTILRVEGECLAPAQRGSIPIPDIPEDEHNLYGDPNFYRELTDADMEEELELDI